MRLVNVFSLGFALFTLCIAIFRLNNNSEKKRYKNNSNEMKLGSVTKVDGCEFVITNVDHGITITHRLNCKKCILKRNNLTLEKYGKIITENK